MPRFRADSHLLRPPEGHALAWKAQILLGTLAIVDAPVAGLYFWTSCDEVSGLRFLAMMMVDTFHWTLVFSAGIVFLTWLWRARKNAEFLRVSQMRIPRYMVVLGFFVPVLNLAVPLFAMQEIWIASTPATDEPDGFEPRPPAWSPLITALWGACVLFMLSSLIVAVTTPRPRALPQSFFFGKSLVTAIIPIAAVLAILVIREMQRRQDERWKKLVADDAMR